MEDKPVHIIRESSRNILQLNRQIHREEQSDLCRSINTTRVTKETVLRIVNILKTKSITSKELHILKNAILNEPDFIAAVLSNPGSLKGLVREISGTDVNKQTAAAGCCCNLALGDNKACTAIAKAAGSYLVTSLDNLTTDIAVTCAWTLGNIAGSGAKACDTLVSQGALAKLTGMLSGQQEEVVDAALYAVTHFAYQMKDELSKEHVEKLIKTLLKMNLTMAASRLLFVLSCHNDFDLSPEELLIVLQYLSVCIQKHCKECSEPDICCELVYLIRTLANSDVDKTGAMISNYFNTNLSLEYFKTVIRSNNVIVVESLTWLLGNLYNFCGDSGFIGLVFD
ncbi:unnamed protein product [Diatraea saccharalis]|uniref:Uncharacterized protein n=1 Tax=Diatraea saccharalis TaxID=40085 RepID=A0A9N9WDM7_9NEOP|nr:unnamed protein product [Diatraea saccharalis]